MKVAATGVCHADAVMRDNLGVVPMPAILSREGVGIVASVGEAVSNIRARDHVVLSYTACHHYENCLNNHPSTCEGFNMLNSDSRYEDGITSRRLGDQGLSLSFGQSSFSQYVVARASNAAVVDPEVDLILLGSLGCDIQTGSGTVLSRLKPVIGESTMVLGCGAAGLGAIVAMKLTGCSQIVAADTHTSRLALAGELSTTHQIDGKGQGVVALIKQITDKGAYYAIETTGVSAIVPQVVHAVKSLGMVAIVDFTGSVTPNVQNDPVAKGKSLAGVIEGDTVPALSILLLVQQCKQGKFPIDKLTIRCPLTDINQAFVDSASGEAVKPVVVM